jgi:hypothetical protein
MTWIEADAQGQIEIAFCGYNYHLSVPDDSSLRWTKISGIVSTGDEMAVVTVWLPWT